MTTHLKKTLLSLMLTLAGTTAALAQSHSDGMAAMQLENWDKAIKTYTALTQQNPTDQVAWLTLGSAYLAKGDKAKAKETFDAAFNAKAEGTLAMIANGRVLLLMDKTAEADETFKRAKKKADRKDVTGRRLLAESFMYNMPGVKRNLTRAEEELKEAIDVSAKDFATVMSLAYCYKEMPNGGLSAQNYEFAASLEPKNALPVYMLAKVYRAAKLNDKFLNYVDKAIALQPNYSEALRSKTEFLYFDKKWEKALEAAKELVGKASEVIIEDEMILANLLYITKDCVACSALVDKILKKDPSRNYLRRLQAYCDYDNGKFLDGLRLLEDFFKQVPPEKVLASDYEYLGKLQIKAGRDTLEAVQNYRKSIEMDSSKWPLHEEIAQMFYKSKKFCDAAIAYQAYIDSLTETQTIVNATYYLGLSHYYCTADSLRFVKAEKAFSRITQLVPDAGIGWVWRAKALSKQDPDVAGNPGDTTILNEFGKAQPSFEKYVVIGEKDPVKNKKDLISAYEYLVYYYFLKKDDVKAREHLQNLFRHDPSNPTGIEIQKFMDGETPAPPPIKDKKKD